MMPHEDPYHGNLDLAQGINALDMGTPFTISPSGELLDRPDDLHAPEVTIVEGTAPADIEIGDPRFEALTGLSNQQGYSGPIMHSSEFISVGMVRDLRQQAHLDGHPMTLVATEVIDPSDPDALVGLVLLKLTA